MIFRYNPYELLYMYQTGDPMALGMMAEAYGGFLNTIVEQTIMSCPQFSRERDDLFMECLLALHDAADCYRMDMESSFSTFLTVLSRRRIWRMLRPKLRNICEAGTKEVYLEDAITETECWYDVISQRGRMYEPEYFTAYQDLREQLDAMFLKLRKEDQRVLYSWIQGDNYRKASEKLGMTLRAYEGRLNRLRTRVRQKGSPQQPERMA